MALNDSFIKNIKYSGAGAGDKHSDGGGLLVTATSKYWLLACRHLGKQKTLATAVYPAVLLPAARDARTAARR